MVVAVEALPGVHVAVAVPLTVPLTVPLIVPLLPSKVAAEYVEVVKAWSEFDGACGAPDTWHDRKTTPTLLY